MSTGQWIHTRHSILLSAILMGNSRPGMLCYLVSGYCECTFAEELMDLGQLTCDDGAQCPQGCPICNNCLRMLGCINTSHSCSVRGILGFCLAYRGKPKDAHLMDLESERSGKQKLWIIPVDGGLPAENGATSSPVWLIPDDVSYTESESYIEMQEAGQNRQGNSPPTKPS
jgi:hypothetical protein